MTNRRFPVAGTDLTIPWEIAEQTYREACTRWPAYPELKGRRKLSDFRRRGFTESELDIWYGKHWRKVAR